MSDIIHQGDQYKVYLDFYTDDKMQEPLKNEYTDLELTIHCLLENGVSKDFQYYFSKGELQWDVTEEKFYFRLTQETSFLFKDKISYQLRTYLPNNDVYGSDKMCMPIGKTISKKVFANGGEV